MLWAHTQTFWLRKFVKHAPSPQNKSHWSSAKKVCIHLVIKATTNVLAFNSKLKSKSVTYSFNWKLKIKKKSRIKNLIKGYKTYLGLFVWGMKQLVTHLNLLIYEIWEIYVSLNTVFYSNAIKQHFRLNLSRQLSFYLFLLNKHFFALRWRRKMKWTKSVFYKVCTGAQCSTLLCNV